MERHLIITTTVVVLLGLMPAMTGRIMAQSTDLTLDTTLFKTHLRILGSDSLEGRGTGQPGGRKAAGYIRDHLLQWGLTPMGTSGTWFQHVPLHGVLIQPESLFEISTGDQSDELELWRDYIPLNVGDQTFVPRQTGLVFVGYGIVAPEYDYNDYQNISVENRIVVFLSGEPASSDTDYFDGPAPTVHSNITLKHRVAMARGARGSVLIPSPGDPTYRDWDHWVAQYRFEDVRLPYGPTDHFHAMVRPACAGRLFDGARHALDDVFRWDASGTVRSFDLAARLTFSGRFRERDFTMPNIIGKIEGADPLRRDSYVIVSAHYDHLGIGQAVHGDSIYNGVFDNAAGTAAVLELARALGRSSRRPPRSVLFVFLAAEEKGLLGSTFYADHPVVPLYKTVAAINVDGLAMFDTFRDVVGVGAEFSTLGESLERSCSDLSLQVSPVPDVFKSSLPFSSSDQYTFATYGIPSMLVTEGLQYEHTPYEEGLARYVRWGQSIYHSPSDDLDQAMQVDAALRHMEVLLALVMDVARTFIPPQWVSGQAFMLARLQSMAEQR